MHQIVVGKLPIGPAFQMFILYSIFLCTAYCQKDRVPEPPFLRAYFSIVVDFANDVVIDMKKLVIPL